MITEQDIKEAIAECQGVRNPTANTCIKLAAFYTILDHITEGQETAVKPSYSYFSPSVAETIDYESETDFGQVLSGKNASEMWKVMDELMTTLQAIQPRLYDAVMRKVAG